MQLAAAAAGIASQQAVKWWPLSGTHEVPVAVHARSEGLRIHPFSSKPSFTLCVIINICLPAFCAHALPLPCVQDVVTVAQYNQYCHYVAGLVGIGLSNLFGEQPQSKLLAGRQTCLHSGTHVHTHACAAAPHGDGQGDAGRAAAGTCVYMRS